jgi:hypothetical protein
MHRPSPRDDEPSEPLIRRLDREADDINPVPDNSDGWADHPDRRPGRHNGALKSPNNARVSELSDFTRFRDRRCR